MNFLRIRHLFWIALFFLGSCQSAWNSADRTSIPNDEDFRSVLLLGDGRGHLASGFILVRNGKEYVVTAKHFAQYMTGRDTIEVFVNGGWIRSPTYLVGHAKGDVDISVFTFTRANVLKPSDETPVLSANETLTLGSSAWYLGFPLGYLFDNGTRNYPYPLLKHAYLSAQNDRPVLFYFDGLCNPGFSGAPVYAKTTEGNLRLIGVVSSRLKETTDSQASSGIFLAYSAHYAELIIDENPIGAPVQ